MTDPQFSTITMVLPQETVAGISAYAKQYGMTRGALIRAGLRLLGAPVPDEEALGFTAAPPPAA